MITSNIKIIGIYSTINMWMTQVKNLIGKIQECPICYSSFHTSSRSIPSKKCQTCNNTFHSECLLRWFNSSQKSNCPLCQSIIYN